MEAVPRMPMLAFDLKPCSESVEFGPQIKKYVRSHYHEDPSSYNKECTELDQLRHSATKVSRDFIGCSTLKKYYAQLHLLQSRIPMGDGGEAALVFTWDDVYAENPVSHPDIKFEQAAILFNIGALHSVLGSMDNRQTPEGMKVSCTHFQCAAWAFQHLRDHFGANLSPDMTWEVLTFKMNLMLAQAQECILEKSMLDNRKSTITAKVAAQIVEYYKTAKKWLSACVGSSLIDTRKYKDWKKRLELKILYNTCIMYLYIGNQAEEQQKWGERLAYYQGAQDKLNECQKLAKNEGDDIGESLRFTMDVVGGKFNAAKKDNEFVYHDKVPALDSLPEIKGASLVKGIPFNTSDPEVSGPDIFARLVPMEAHEAASLYSEEKARLLRQVCGEIEEKNQELLQYISSLQLDQSVLNPEPERLPEILMEKCAAISVRPDAIKDLIAAMQELSSISIEVEGGVNEAGDLFEEEIKKDEEFQQMFGKRAPNMIIGELKKEAGKYGEAHKKASQSNQELHKAMNAHIANLKLLSGPIEELQSAIPSVEQNKSPEDQEIFSRMTHLMSKIDEMRQQREMLEEQFRKQVHEDDVTKRILSREDGNMEEFFKEELKKHEKQSSLIQQNLNAQTNILRALTDTNARYAGVRRSLGDVTERRAAMVQGLVQSYDVYEDLLAKSQKGIEFFKKLDGNVKRLLQRLKGVLKVQQEERQQVMDRHKPKGPPPSRPVAPKPGQPGASSVLSGPKLKDYLPYMKPESFGDLPKEPQGPTLKDYLPYMKPETFGNLKPSGDPAFTGPTLKDYLPDMKPESFGKPDQKTIEGPTLKDYLPHMKPESFGKPDQNAPEGLTLKDYLPYMKPESFGPKSNLGKQQQGFPQNGIPAANQMPYSIPQSSTGDHVYSHPNISVPSSLGERTEGDGAAPQELCSKPSDLSAAAVGNMGNMPMPHGMQSIPGSHGANTVHTHNTPIPTPSHQQQLGQPINPAQPGQPINPGQPVNQMQPGQPVNPKQMGGPPNPTQPVHNPTQPGQVPTSGPTYQHPAASQPYNPTQISGQSPSTVQYNQQMYHPPQAGSPAPAGAPQLGPAGLNQPSSQHVYHQPPAGNPTQMSQQSYIAPQHTNVAQAPTHPNITPVPQQAKAPTQPTSVPAAYPPVPGSTAQSVGQYQQPPYQAPVNTPAVPVSSAQASQYHQPQSGQANYQVPQQTYYGQVGGVANANVPAHSSPIHQAHGAGQGQPSVYQAAQTGVSVAQAGQAAVSGSQANYQIPASNTPLQNLQGQQTQLPGSKISTSIPQSAVPQSHGLGAQTQMYPSGSPGTQQAGPGTIPYGQQNVGSAQMQSFPQGAPASNLTGTPGYGQQFVHGQNSAANVPQQTGQMYATPSSSVTSQYGPQQGMYTQPGQGQVGYSQMAGYQQQPIQTNQQQPVQTNQQMQQPVQTAQQMQQPAPTNQQQMQTQIGTQYMPQQQITPHQSPVHQPHTTAQQNTQQPGAPTQFYQQPQNQPFTQQSQPSNQINYQQQINSQQNFQTPQSYQQPLTPHQSPAHQAHVQPYQQGANQVSQQPQSPAHHASVPSQQINTLPSHLQQITPQPPAPYNLQLTRQMSASSNASTDDLLSTSPDNQQSAASTASVLIPKVLTQEEILKQKEEAQRAKTLQKSTSKDPFCDSEHLEKFVEDVEKFEKIVVGLCKPTLSGVIPLDKEWKDLNDQQDTYARKHPMAIARCYPMKNRSPDVMPYDQFRVSLKGQKDDYINASNLGAPTGSSAYFISTQAPLPTTMREFWLMVYEQGTEVIVALVSENDMTRMKFPFYFPNNKGEVLEFGLITVSLQNIKRNQAWIERVITMTHKESKQTRAIMHLQFTSWEGIGVPETPGLLLQFITEVQNYHKQQRNPTKPIIVHCSAGVGRTGVFCTVYAGVQEINTGNGIIDVIQVVSTLRQRCKYMVQEKEQFKFCYSAILYYAEDLLMKRGILTNKASFGDKLPAPGDKTHSRKPSEDFILGTTSLSTIESNISKMTFKKYHVIADSNTGGQVEGTPVATEQQMMTQPQQMMTQSQNMMTSQPNMMTSQDQVPQQPMSGQDLQTQTLSQMSLSTDSLSNISMNQSFDGSQQQFNRSRSNSNSSVLSGGSYLSLPSHGSPQHSVTSIQPNQPGGTMLPQSLADLQNPSTFTLEVNTKPNKVTKASFLQNKSHIQDSCNDPADPLSMLDPLWTIKKK